MSSVDAVAPNVTPISTLSKACSATCSAVGSIITPDRVLFVVDLSAAVLSTANFYLAFATCTPISAVPCILNTAGKIAEVALDTGLHLTDAIISKDTRKKWGNWIGIGHLARFGWAAYNACTFRGSACEVSGAVEELTKDFKLLVDLNKVDFPFHIFGAGRNFLSYDPIAKPEESKK